MCTLSIIAPAPRSFVLAFNRDEKPTRAETDPRVHTGRRTWIMPGDTQAGGSWIAVNDAGIALAVLNRNDGPPPADAPADLGASRGTLVPALAECGSLDEIRSGAERIAAGISRAFRLIATDGTRVLEVVGGDHRADCALEPLVRPFLRASSGLGDALVREPRGELFAAIVARAPDEDLAAAQHHFHRHRWNDRRHLSVLMDREGARTVSITTIIVDDARVQLVHARRGDGGGLPESLPELRLELDRR